MADSKQTYQQATPEEVQALESLLNQANNSQTHGGSGSGNGYNGGNDNTTGGGHQMNNDYVTHEELSHVEDNLKHEIKESKLETQNNFTDLSGKIDKLSANIDTKFAKVDTKFANQKVWLIGTVITVVSAGVGILSYIMSIMLNH